MTTLAATSPIEREVNDMARRRLLDQDGEPMPSTSEPEHDSPCAFAQVMAERVEHLEAYEDKQNGTLGRFEKKLDDMCTSVNEKIDRLTWRIMGGMGSVLLVLVGYIIEESIRR